MYVFARETASVRVLNQSITIKRGKPRHRLDPVVLAHPEMFSEEPVEYDRFPGWVPPELDVEQATKAPGERRATRRGI